MQVCYNCGKEVSDETLICPDCGALVKRYTTPPAREQTPETTSFMTSYQEDAFQEPQQTASNPQGSVWRDARGRVHFRAGLIVWLALCILYAGYMSLTYACIQIVYLNQDFYLSFLEAFPEFADLAVVMREMIQIIGSVNFVFVALLLLSLGSFVCSIWLLAGRQRAALYAFLGVTLLMTIVSFFLNYSFALVGAIGCAVTFFWFKKYIPLLR